MMTKSDHYDYVTFKARIKFNKLKKLFRNTTVFPCTVINLTNYIFDQVMTIKKDNANAFCLQHYQESQKSDIFRTENLNMDGYWDYSASTQETEFPSNSNFKNVGYNM